MTGEIRNPVKLLPSLLPAEKKFARCLAEGKLCRIGNGQLPKPEERIESGEGANVVRGGIIRFFAYGGNEENPVLGSEISLKGAWISGDLDLAHASIPYALTFSKCHFGVDVNMQYAECVMLDMAGSCLTQQLRANMLKTKKDLRLGAGFFAKRGVWLLGASIGGNFQCGRGKFVGQRFALVADKIAVKGDVFLRDGFYAKGEVRILGANIDGKLDCAGGRFDNQGDFDSEERKIYAFNAERVKTGGHVYLNLHKPRGGSEPFVANGRVRFANANIGGNFNCKGGQFLHSGERSAIAAGGLRSRAVFLSEKFSAKGEVALHVAHIGNFVCTDCVRNCQSPITINLASTKSAAVDDDKNSWKPFEFILDGFTYDTFYGYSPTDSKSRLDWLARRPKQKRLKDGKMVALPFSPLPYEQAAKVLFGMGHDNDAREILLKKEREITQRKKWWQWQKSYRWLWGEFADYGYKPWKTLAWALAVVAIGWGVFSEANRIDGIVPHQPAILASQDYESKKSTSEQFPEYPEFNPLVFSMDVFIPVFALHQEPFWYPTAGSEDAFAWLRDSFAWLWGWLAGHQEILGLAIGGAILWIFLLVALAEEFFLGTRNAWVGEGMIRLGSPLIVRIVVVLCLYALGMTSPRHWYWLEIGFGWLLTSLFLLSVTGLLRPRQSSGEKN